MASTKSAATVVEEKKPKSTPSHPPYVEMIKEAIVALKERTGSSQIAIAKFIEGKEKHLPANFKRNLLVQLKKLVANGKLIKVKNSFKLAPAQSVKPKPTAEPKKRETVSEKKPAAPKKATTKKTSAVVPKTKGKKEVVTSPVKKAAAKKVKSLKVVKSPMKKAAPVSKKVKSIKSPKKKSIKSPKKKRVTAAAAKK